MVMPALTHASANPNTVGRQLAPYQRGYNTYRGGTTSGGGQANSDIGRVRAESYMRRARLGNLEGPVTIRHKQSSMQCNIDAEGYLTCD